MIFTCPFLPAVTAMWTAIVSTVPLLSAADQKIKLMKNNPAINANTLIGDIHEADFASYAAFTQSFSAEIYFDAVTSKKRVRWLDIEEGVKWSCIGTTNVPQDVYGVYLTNAAGTVLTAYGKFPLAVTMTNGSGLNLDDLEMELPPSPLL